MGKVWGGKEHLYVLTDVISPATAHCLRLNPKCFRSLKHFLPSNSAVAELEMFKCDVKLCLFGHLSSRKSNGCNAVTVELPTVGFAPLDLDPPLVHCKLCFKNNNTN